jgi:hypothetical protein
MVSVSVQHLQHFVIQMEHPQMKMVSVQPNQQHFVRMARRLLKDVVQLGKELYLQDSVMQMEHPQIKTVIAL